MRRNAREIVAAAAFLATGCVSAPQLPDEEPPKAPEEIDAASAPADTDDRKHTKTVLTEAGDNDDGDESDEEAELPKTQGPIEVTPPRDDEPKWADSRRQAVEDGDAAACIDEGHRALYCVMEVALELEDPLQCTHLDGLPQVGSCMIVYAYEHPEDDGVCNSLADEYDEDQRDSFEVEYLDNCHWHRAHRLDDAELCEPIDSERLRRDCRFGLQNPEADTEFVAPFDVETGQRLSTHMGPDSDSMYADQIVIDDDQVLLELGDLPPFETSHGELIYHDAQYMQRYPTGFLDVDEHVGEKGRFLLGACHSCTAGMMHVTAVEVDLGDQSMRIIPGSSKPHFSPDERLYMAFEETGEHVMTTLRLVDAESLETIARYGRYYNHADALDLETRLIEALHDVVLLSDYETELWRGIEEHSERGRVYIDFLEFTDDSRGLIFTAHARHNPDDPDLERVITLRTDLALDEWMLIDDCLYHSGEQLECE